MYAPCARSLTAASASCAIRTPSVLALAPDPTLAMRARMRILSDRWSQRVLIEELVGSDEHVLGSTNVCIHNGFAANFPLELKSSAVPMWHSAVGLLLPGPATRRHRVQLPAVIHDAEHFGRGGVNQSLTPPNFFSPEGRFWRD